MGRLLCWFGFHRFVRTMGRIFVVHEACVRRGCGYTAIRKDGRRG